MNDVKQAVALLTGSLLYTLVVLPAVTVVGPHAHGGGNEAALLLLFLPLAIALLIELFINGTVLMQRAYDLLGATPAQCVLLITALTVDISLVLPTKGIGDTVSELAAALLTTAISWAVLSPAVRPFRLRLILPICAVPIFFMAARIFNMTLQHAYFVKHQSGVMILATVVFGGGVLFAVQGIRMLFTEDGRSVVTPFDRFDSALRAKRIVLLFGVVSAGSIRLHLPFEVSIFASALLPFALDALISAVKAKRRPRLTTLR